MDVTDRNIGLLMAEFWMLPIIISARESDALCVSYVPLCVTRGA